LCVGSFLLAQAGLLNGAFVRLLGITPRRYRELAERS